MTAKKEAPQWRAFTALERRAAYYLAGITYPPGTGAKRLARSLAYNSVNTHRITEKQALAMWALVWRFRRQIAAEDLVAHAQRLHIPSIEGAILQ